MKTQDKEENKMIVDDLEIPSSMWFSVGLVATQSFLFGYVFAGLNSCLVVGSGNDGSACFNNEPDSDCPPGTIYNDIDLTTFDTQLATSLVIIGAWIGCLISSYPSEKYGRRTTLLYNNFFFIIGAILCSLGYLNSLFIGRFIAGFGVGLESMLAPVLLAEIAHPSSRGKITTMHQVCLTFAIFFVSILSYIFVSHVDHGWQYVQLGSAIPSIIMLIFASYVPESPKWLLSQDLRKEAEKVMIQLRPIGYNSKDEIDLIEAESLSNSKLETTWTDVFACKNAMIIGCGLLLFQAITGINSVIFYSTTIFKFAGFDESILATASVGALNFLMTCFSAYFIDKMGRKVLLVIGCYTMLGSLILLACVLLLADHVPHIQGIIAVLAVLIYVAGFASGLGAVVWVMMSEIMPTHLRTKAVSLFLSINWGANLIVGLITLSAINELGGVTDDMTDDSISLAQKHGVGWLYSVFACTTFLLITFIHTFVPETRGKNPENFNISSMNNPLLSKLDIEDN